MIFLRGFIVLLLFLSHFALAGDFRVLDLQHRGATEMADTIRPMLQPDENVSVMGSQLILSASPQRLDMLSALVKQLDTRLHQFRISVRTDQQMAQAQQQLAISGRIAGDHATVRVPPAAHANAPTIAIRDGQSALQIAAQDQSAQGRENVSQVLTVMEGYPATLAVGEARPVPSYSVIQQGNRITEVHTQDYVAANTGMTVVARMQGERVMLQIRPQEAAFNDQGGIRSSAAETSLSVMPGQWVQLGGIDQQQLSSGQTIGAVGQNSGLAQSAIWLKVDVLK